MYKKKTIIKKTSVDLQLLFFYGCWFFLRMNLAESLKKLQQPSLKFTTTNQPPENN